MITRAFESEHVRSVICVFIYFVKQIFDYHFFPWIHRRTVALHHPRTMYDFLNSLLLNRYITRFQIREGRRLSPFAFCLSRLGGKARKGEHPSPLQTCYFTGPHRTDLIFQLYADVTNLEKNIKKESFTGGGGATKLQKKYLYLNHIATQATGQNRNPWSPHWSRKEINQMTKRKIRK